jgi:hypoxanthine phosphoribosyltransferase
VDSREHSYIQAYKQIARVTNSLLPLKKVLNSVAKSTAKGLRAAGCSIILLNPQKAHFDIVAAFGLSDLYLRKGAIKASESLPEVLNGETVSIFDATQDKRTQYPEAAESEGISSVLATPILQKGEVTGEIRVYTREPRQFSPADKDFTVSVANIVAVNLEKNELYQLLTTEHEETVAKRRKLPSIPRSPSSSLRPSSFGHPSEEEFAKLLDFYRVEWLYEPRSFPLAWQDNKVSEMFTPDFYLPELDIYIELTTLKQSLITEKNRKLRRLRELYPEINIKLLNKNDYLRLLAKYGYGRLGETRIEGIDHVLLSHTQIQRRVKALAKRITRDYSGRKLVLVGILRGVICFMADLMQNIPLQLAVDLMAISYYGTDNESSVKITKDLDTSITGCDVLMVEDIVDTGMTLNYVLSHLASHNPASLRVCTLLDKRVRRLIDVPLDYIGFEIPDEFVVGYGLDYHGEYRNLSFIGALNPQLIEEEHKK